MLISCNSIVDTDKDNTGRERETAHGTKGVPRKKSEQSHRLDGGGAGLQSITNRALLLAALSAGEVVLHGVLFRMIRDIFLGRCGSLGFRSL